MTHLDPSRPIAWVGEDRILLNDTSRYGLRRKVIARKDGMMDVEMWMDTTMQFEARGNSVIGWLVQRDDGFWYLWIVWKDKR